MVVFWVRTPTMKEIDLCTCVFFLKISVNMGRHPHFIDVRKPSVENLVGWAVMTRFRLT